MKIMFNGLDRPFELLNLRYGHEYKRFGAPWSTLTYLSLYIYTHTHNMFGLLVNDFIILYLSIISSSVELMT
jgi:hypothetical protein